MWQNVGVFALLTGIALIGAGVFLWLRARPTYQLFVGTAGGDRPALSSEDGIFVQRVATAINNALVARG